MRILKSFKMSTVVSSKESLPDSTVIHVKYSSTITLVGEPFWLPSIKDRNKWIQNADQDEGKNSQNDQSGSGSVPRRVNRTEQTNPKLEAKLWSKIQGPVSKLKEHEEWGNYWNVDKNNKTTRHRLKGIHILNSWHGGETICRRANCWSIPSCVLKGLLILLC